jgi:hypothetical protein
MFSFDEHAYASKCYNARMIGISSIEHGNHVGIFSYIVCKYCHCSFGLESHMRHIFLNITLETQFLRLVLYLVENTLDAQMYSLINILDRN